MEIKEVDSKVIIDGFEFYGQIEQEKCCSTCKFNLIYYDEYDAYFCLKCNRWIESKCSDTSCKYCSKRPGKPLYFAK